VSIVEPTFSDPRQRQDVYGTSQQTSPGDSEGVYVAARRNRWRLWLMLVVVVAIGYGMFRLGWFDVAEDAR